MSYLISHGLPVLPPSVEEAAYVLASDIDLARLLVDAWTDHSVLAVDCLCEAVCVCDDARVLRQIVRILDKALDCAGPCRIKRDRCLDEPFLNAGLRQDVTFMWACLRLGADVDVARHFSACIWASEYAPEVRIWPM